MWVDVGKKRRFHGTAKDGQRVHLYLTPHKAQRFTVWTVGLYIGGKNRTANDWYEKIKPTSHTTGKGSLAALQLALGALLDFANRLPVNAEIQCGWEDERRKNAWRYLLRYDGWTETDEFYLYRNPKHWELIEEGD